MEVLLSIVRAVRDPRAENASHDCSAMLFIALAASLCGAKSCVAIADFAAAGEAELARIVDLRHGAPSHDCFSRLFRLLDPDELVAMLSRFARALREGLGLGAPTGVVAVDGKSLKRAYERGKAAMPAMMVSVWDARTRLIIAAKRAPGGNEVAGVLDLLRGLVLDDCIVTGDALHCHPGMAEEVLATGADYALRVKGNHAPLYAAVTSAFAQADAAGGLPFKETSECGHDREEWRCASVLPCPSNAPAFPGLVAIGRIEDERQYRGQIETWTRYYALSKAMTPSELLTTARSHWSIENQEHWHLDVSLSEDAARTRKDHGPENVAIIRRMALDILSTHPDKRSIARKMQLAAWSKDFFYDLFAHMR